ncbi:MAG: leucyl/phenylalanyl-tRNA--protein transferase [Burkholderiales bacterium]|nr:leucyl/phenylalanyl-tRNA--protein transferase [Burkholderiales bacterium]
MIPWLTEAVDFPPVHKALRRPNGLLAAGGDLSPERLIAAYRLGIFPWYGADDPILWWSPDPRMVLYPQELRIGRTLGKTLRKGHYRVTVDRAFREVIGECSAPRADRTGTWITAEMLQAYCLLHQRGIAHSVETWHQDRLVGGLYGVALGRMFYGESMFSRMSDASKVAFVHLVRQLVEWEFGLIDCQMRTDLLASFGAREIPRMRFSRLVAELVHYPDRLGPWTFVEVPPAVDAGA